MVSIYSSIASLSRSITFVMTPVDELIVNPICPGGLTPMTMYETSAFDPNAMITA